MVVRDDWETPMTGISFSLNDEETELVQEILEEQHRTLLLEISHADHHDFKAMLRKRVELLESILSRFTVHA